MKLVLASASPRRRALLDEAGLAFDVGPVNVDERVVAGETPEPYVMRLALEKARAGLAQHPASVVLGADTTVVIDDEILGKPNDDADAQRMLEQLSGRPHQVLTGVAIAWSGGDRVAIDRTTVWFKTLSPADIAQYVATGEPRDKAGAYAIQGLASRFIERIDGSYSNVVGLPVAVVLQLLAAVGVTPARPPAASSSDSCGFD
jgi:septum formation protein